jgi:hypothetical protein
MRCVFKRAQQRGLRKSRLPLSVLQIAKHYSQQIIEVMSDTSRQPADSLHFGGVPETVLYGLATTNVPDTHKSSRLMIPRRIDNARFCVDLITGRSMDRDLGSLAD